MNIFGDKKTEYRKDLVNALAQASNALWQIQHKSDTWDTRIAMLQQLQKLVPLMIRYMVYFKNTEENR